MKFVGDPVSLVVAQNRYVAEDAVELVDVDYQPLPAVTDFTKAVGSDVVVHEAYPDNVAGGMGGAIAHADPAAEYAAVALAHGRADGGDVFARQSEDLRRRSSSPACGSRRWRPTRS